MRKSKFSEAQTIRILKEAETGNSIREIEPSAAPHN